MDVKVAEESRAHLMRGGDDAWPPSEVIVGEVGSEEARSAVALALGIGGLFRARGLLVRSYPTLPEADSAARTLDARTADDALRKAERKLVKRADKLGGALGRWLRGRLAAGDPAANLLDASRASVSPLLAVGTKRLRLGSTSTKVLRAASGSGLSSPTRQQERRAMRARSFGARWRGDARRALCSDRGVLRRSSRPERTVRGTDPRTRRACRAASDARRVAGRGGVRLAQAFSGRSARSFLGRHAPRRSYCRARQGGSGEDTGRRSSRCTGW